MPNPLELLIALAAAAAASTLVILAILVPLRLARFGDPKAGPKRGGTLPRIAAILGPAAGFYAGCWLLEIRPDWPPAQDKDRFLFLILPAVVAIELLASALPALSRWLWAGRLGLALLTPRILLHGSMYLANLDEPGPDQWSTAQAVAILGGIAIALALIWGLFVRSQRQSNGPSTFLFTVIITAAAGILIALSGYLSGGQMGMVLAAAMVTGVAFFWRSPANLTGTLGLGIVGLFSLLTMGIFFGELTWVNAGLIYLGLCLCLVPDTLPVLRQPGSRVRAGLRLGLPIVPVAIALALAGNKFAQDYARTSNAQDESSAQEYLEGVK